MMKSFNMKIVLSLLIIFFSNQLFAQSNTLSSGGYSTGSGGSSTYSVGQIFYQSNNGNTHIETQGLQQPFEILIITGVSNKAIKAYCYPNPTKENLIIEIEDNGLLNRNYDLKDENGKIILTGLLNIDKTIIDLKSLNPSIYILSIRSENSIEKSFKIIKK